MKTSISHLVLVCSFLFSFSTGYSQQVKTTGTEETMPNKTVVIRDPGSEQPAAFLTGVEILRFWIYKAGSTDDVARIAKSLSSADGVKKVTEGPVSGDMKEFVIELASPRDLAWYRKTFTKAGLKHIKLNTAGVKPVSEL